MEKWKKRSINLLFSLIFGGDQQKSTIAYYPQKERVGDFEQKFFRRSSPERHGISSKRLYNMLSSLESERRANIHSLMVVAGGEVICECSAEGYDVGGWQASHSMSKTVVGIIIGSLVDEKLVSVESRLVDIFPEVEYRDKKFPLITLHHLLSMTAGVEFGETGAVTETDWMSAFFGSAVKSTPGSRLSYNSMNTYILARVAEKLTGRSFAELAEDKFFAPMGIKSYLWEKGPDGCEKGGWGLYMSPESWAKVGYMMLRKGEIGGRRIISSDWVAESRSFKAEAPRSYGDFDYAYQMWTAREGDEYLFSGMLGQCVWICPKNDIVVVMTGGNEDLYQANPAVDIIRAYLGVDINDRLSRWDIYLLRDKERGFLYNRRWIRRRVRRGGLRLFRLGRGEERGEAFGRIAGSYAFGKNSLGLLPLVVRTMQNCLGAELKGITLTPADRGLHVVFHEGDGDYDLIAGYEGHIENIVKYREEQFRVMALAGYVQTGGVGECRIELVFSETSSVKRIKILKEGDKISLSMSETPGSRLVENLLSVYSSRSPALSLAEDILRRRFGENVIADMASKTFNPTLIGISTEVRGYENFLCEMELGDQPPGVRLARTIAERFFSDEK